MLHINYIYDWLKKNNYTSEENSKSTLAIHLLDSTRLTNPGPATEQVSTISEAGRFFEIAYVKKKTEENKS